MNATLFDPDTLAVDHAAVAARKSDPATSHAAAASMRDFLGPDQRMVLEAVAAISANTCDGATAHEIVRRLRAQGIDRDQNSVAKRLTELGEGGKRVPGLHLIRRPGHTRPGRSGRCCLVAVLTEAGRTALQGEA